MKGRDICHEGLGLSLGFRVCVSFCYRRCWLRVSSLLQPLMRLLAAGRRLGELGTLATRLPSGGPLGGPPEETSRRRLQQQQPTAVRPPVSLKAYSSVIKGF